ncbi:hypothetical protein [Corynebacterium stationis]|uniref:hypothetical protein n=1 Tax=Corynebacterium stationis TaxID=1705 RepID=UPI0028AB915F|nr:hypothetical protein [Corynebacterium stationis]
MRKCESILLPRPLAYSTESTHQALAGTGTGVGIPKFFEIKRQIKGELNFE